MVEVKDGFVVKDGNTETNSIVIQTNGMQRVIDCGDTKKEFGAANSLGILPKMQGATNGWKHMEQFGETNAPERMHGACDSVAGGMFFVLQSQEQLVISLVHATTH